MNNCEHNKCITKHCPECGVMINPSTPLDELRNYLQQQTKRASNCVANQTKHVALCEEQKEAGCLPSARYRKDPEKWLANAKEELSNQHKLQKKWADRLEALTELESRMSTPDTRSFKDLEDERQAI